MYAVTECHPPGSCSVWPVNWLGFVPSLVHSLAWPAGVRAPTLIRTGSGYAITTEQGVGRFGDPLGAYVRDGASARRHGRARLPLGASAAWAVGRLQRCRLR